MKRLFTIVAFMAATMGFVNAQCTIDSSHLATPGVYPAPDSLPCIIQNVAYDQTVQGRIQAGKDTTVLGQTGTVTVDSISIDTISGLPAGINWTKYPNVLQGGGTGCITFSGTTTAAVGDYTLTATGRAWFTINAGAISNYHYAYHGDLTRFSAFGGYHLTVVASFSDCTHITGVNEVNNDLTSLISIYPNPNTGIFEFKLESGKRVSGDMRIFDVTGKVVYTQLLDVTGFYNTTIDLSKFSKGLYTLQIRTADGFASKNISVE
ncbi:MAG: hypothetical protein JWO06_3652 [Bacteroidota bacterium]|nr:hypothetical protein [Bacteroidota bacterium]